MGPLFAGIGAAEGTVQLPYQPKQPAAVAVAMDDRIPTRVLVRPKERETLREIHAEIEIEIDVEVERDKICTYYSSPYPCQYGPNVCTCSALVAAAYPNKTIHIPNRLCISRPCWITLVTLGHRFRQKRLVRIQMERQKKQKVRQTKIEQAKKWGVGGVGEVESDEEKNDGSNKVDTKGPQPQQQPQQQANPAPTIELEMVDRQPQPGSSMVGRPEDSDRTIVVDAFDDHGEDGDEGAFGNLGMGGGRITSLDHGPGPQEQQVGRPSDGRSSRGMSADLYHTRTSSVSSSSPSSLRKSSKRRSGRMKKKFSAGGGQVKKGHSSRTLKYLGSLGTADQISAVGSLGSKQVLSEEEVVSVRKTMEGSLRSVKSHEQLAAVGSLGSKQVLSEQDAKVVRETMKGSLGKSVGMRVGKAGGAQGGKGEGGNRAGSGRAMVLRSEGPTRTRNVSVNIDDLLGGGSRASMEATTAAVHPPPPPHKGRQDTDDDDMSL